MEKISAPILSAHSFRPILSPPFFPPHSFPPFFRLENSAKGRLDEIASMFPTEQAAHDWMVKQRWGDTGRHCPRCGSDKTTDKGGVMAYWCGSCRRRFSVRTGTVLERSKIPLRKWCLAIYICVTNLKGVSSMKLHRDLGITQKSAWFMAHRIREAWSGHSDALDGAVEVDETYIGGKEHNKHAQKRLRSGRGTIGKAVVIGAKSRDTKQVRAEVIAGTDRRSLHSFVTSHTAPGSTVYTDEHSGYYGIPFKHRIIRHSVGQYVKDQIHTNGIESFWSMLKRAHKGTFHKMSVKHLQRYVNEFAGRHGIRDKDTLRQMVDIVGAMVGKRLMYRELVK